MTTLLIATTGGHLTQLADLAERLPGADDTRIWVTHENAQSRSLLAGARAVFVPYVGRYDVAGVARNLVTADRLFRAWRPTRAVSTGSGIALGYLPYLARRGTTCHYIESATRIEQPSVTGRLLRAAPAVRCYTQYRHRARGQWRYGGSVFDGFVSGTHREPAIIRRAIVTVGTAQEFPFRRMLAALVPLLGAGGAVERHQGAPVETLWQTGCTATEGLGIDAHPFVASADLDDALISADLVVSHAGTGSALSALRAGRFPILVPRAPEYGEVADHHQTRFAQELADRGLAFRRTTNELTAADLLGAATRCVQRAEAPPVFELVP